jgi:hypothetical protein
MERCALCGREVERVTRHHLVPRTRHANKKNKKLFDRKEIHDTVDLCSPCHKNIHAHLTEKQLEREYNSLELLASHPDVARFTEWIRSKPAHTAVRVQRSNKYRR